MTPDPPRDRPAPGTTADLADALAERALARAAAALASSAVVLGVLAVALLVALGGELDARTLPPLVLLAWGELAGVGGAGVALTRLRAVRALPGTGPARAGATARGLDVLVRAVPAVGAVAGVALVAVLEPRATSAFSTLVALLVLAQLVVVAAVARRGLRRAALAG